MYGVSPQAYDRAITVFSPDGRLFQVEYAKEAVKRGATAIGMAVEDGVVLVAFKSIHSTLVITDSLKKIFEVDSHVCVTASGLIADARRLVDIARVDAQRHRITYNEAPTVDLIARSVCDLMQVYTQYGGIRPFGVSLLIAGVNSGGESKLYEAEPSGAMTAYKADSIGAHKKEVDEILEQKYDAKLTIDQAIRVCVGALRSTEEEKLRPESVEISFISSKTSKAVCLSDKEIAKYLK
ncbi:archaeal proteasome endopeptidase complex subunit alpha [Candidatus Micrarchaeota archaeon]|nr:archaeal proteasome endopeptidase complex subunit alpha [Candidatus Micrarchaeota archaeon]MBU1165978.1 archaeal proteasome endopeptidase complex subunit alpha [Candidatus Micrarchaeota archaeon]MBU1886941.1 archaeal proteasome endopeptidase complex subunit alpha [Candidatus Micrarchaeota archaeon]